MGPWLTLSHADFVMEQRVLAEEEELPKPICVFAQTLRSDVNLACEFPGEITYGRVLLDLDQLFGW